jgi:hypothetical protein
LISLSSESAQLLVAPELGGRVVEAVDLKAGRQWLWRNYQTPFGPVEPGSSYDDVWQGGIEELFPNDAVTSLDDGSAYPDHGELWSVAWDVIEGSGSSIRLGVTGPVTGVEVTKTISVDGPSAQIVYELSHPGESRVDHLFKLHAAVGIHEDCSIELPGGTVEKVDPGFGTIIERMGPLEWPGTELQQLDGCRPPASGDYEFVYVFDLPAGWCGLIDKRRGARLRFNYPQEVFPYCWLFITYGGWRGHNVVVLEPCTNYPKDLRVAIANGTSATLAPGESRRFEIEMIMEPTSGR